MLLRASLLLVVFFLCSVLRAQEPDSFCEGREECIPDRLEVIFLESGTSLLEYGRFEPERRLDVQVILDTVTDRIQGWSYGVAHDERFLRLVELTTVDTIAHRTCRLGEAIQPEGGGGSINFCVTRSVPGGWISAVIPDGNLPGQVLVGERNALAVARYDLEEDAGTDGTLIRLADGELALVGSPPVEINFTVNGRVGLPSTVTHGRVQTARGPLFRRGDADGDGRFTVTDAIVIILAILGKTPQPFDCPAAIDGDADGMLNISDATAVLRWKFQGGPPLPAPFRACGSAPEDATLPCPEPSPICDR